MLIVILKIAVFMCFLALPLVSFKKKSNKKYSKPSAEARSSYVVTEDGDLELTKYDRKEL
jgi:hypothetical protein